MKVIGVDEVGRGCLFGPVVSAAVAFDSRFPIPEGLTDSKKLSPKKRKELSLALIEGPHFVAIAEASAQEIDQINILKASLLSMKRAVEKLPFSAEEIKEVRVDGIHKIPNLDSRIKQSTLIKGDLKDQAIAAASIVAKVYRDESVALLDKEFPGYGLFQHKGYPTKAHKEALRKLGASAQHRKTFKGVL